MTFNNIGVGLIGCRGLFKLLINQMLIDSWVLGSGLGYLKILNKPLNPCLNQNMAIIERGRDYYILGVFM